MRQVLFSMVALSFAATAAHAQDAGTASTELTTGAYARAEAKLNAEMRIHPNRPELLLNLATVYAKTGRVSEARALYSKVLAQDEVLMDLASAQTIGSHVIARTGLKRIEAVQFTSR